MRFAVDEHFSNEIIGKICRMQHEVVCVPLEGEPDEVWIDRAIINDCDAILSRDIDIPIYLHKIDADYVRWFENFEDIK